MKLKLFFVQPYNCSVENSSDFCQMELIELQFDMGIKKDYSENNLVVFLQKICV